MSARLKLMQAVEEADQKLTEAEKEALAADLVPRIASWSEEV